MKFDFLKKNVENKFFQVKEEEISKLEDELKVHVPKE